MKRNMVIGTLAMSALLATAVWAQDEGKAPPARPNPYVNNPDGDKGPPDARSGEGARPDKPAARTEREDDAVVNQQIIDLLRAKVRAQREGDAVADQPRRAEAPRRGGESPAQPAGPFMGVTLENVPPALSEQLELRGLGAMVASVAEGSPAAKAGIKPFDVIVAVNEEPNVVRNADALVRMLAGMKAGDKVRLFGVHKGKDLDVRVTLGEARTPPAAAPPVRASAGALTWSQSGTTINPWTGAVSGQGVIRIEGQTQALGATPGQPGAFSGWTISGPQMLPGMPGQPIMNIGPTPFGPQAQQPFVQAPPRMLTRFNTDENGHIEMNLVRGQSEFNIRFKSAEEFKAQSPALFQQYMMMLRGG